MLPKLILAMSIIQSLSTKVDKLIIVASFKYVSPGAPASRYPINGPFFATPFVQSATIDLAARPGQGTESQNKQFETKNVTPKITCFPQS
jgi:hypothetical protein